MASENRRVLSGLQQMEFQGTITSERGSPLGTLASVQQELTSMFPGIVFKWSPSGVEKLAALDLREVNLPEIVRRSLAAQPAFLCGIWEQPPLTASFNIGSADSVTCVWITISSDDETGGEVLSLLRAKCGWKVMSPGLQSGQFLSD